MALQFPLNPTNGQTYQSGSSPIYTYNGNVWSLSAGNVGIVQLNAYTASLKQALQTTGSNATMLGNLNVQGTQTSLNQASLQITDKFIRVASGSLSSVQSDGAGLIIDGANVTMSWDSSNSQIKFNTQISASKFIGDGSSLTGISAYTNSDNLTYLNSKGVVSGSSQISYNGISNVPSGIISSSLQLSSSFVQNSQTSSMTAGFATYAFNAAVTSTGTTTDSTLYPVFTSNSASNGYTTLKNHLSGTFYFDGITRKLYAESFVGAIEANNGVISGSSQLTASYDARYTLSGSVQNSILPNNLISSSAQISGLGFISSSTISAGTISSSTQITSLGFVSGSYLTSLSGAISSSTQLTSSFELKGSGIYSSSAQLPIGIISGSSQLPAGIISGSSQLTASYDLRYQPSGAAGVVPAGTISGSSQLTSSYDGRYTLSSSFNTFTSSYNLFTSSLATTGSNNFNGNQVVTGSLTVSSIATISSSIAANASALTLSSGSNLYIQNNGLALITGSIIISGSSQLTGSFTIQSGSITMPNRPAFRVIGTASTDRTAPLTLSGSIVSVDYNEGNYFNTTNGKFTAPIAGLYNVYYNGRVGATNSAMQLIVYKNTNVVQFMWEAAGNTGATHFGVSGIVKLAVNDTLEAKVTVGSIQFDANDNFGITYIG